MSRPLDFVCVVPVYNEARVLDESVRVLVTGLQKRLAYQAWQVVIASNGSTDTTNEIGQRLEQELAPYVRLIVCRQKGRGRALREVIGQLAARRYLYIDVDLPCDLADLPRVLAPLEAGADVVISRRIGYRPLVRRIMTFSLRWLNRLVFGVRASDSQCAVKALSPRAAQMMVQDCRQNGWYLDTELVALSRRRELVIREVPIHWLESRFAGRASKVDIGGDSLKALRSLWQIWRRRQEIGGK